mgnify:CR=1 FL=1
MFSYLVYCIRPFIQEKPMSERKDSKSRRNYLVKCSCPNCTQESEHSFQEYKKVPFWSALIATKYSRQILKL